MSEWITKIREAIKRWEKFVSNDIWAIGTPGEEIPQGFFIQQIRVFILLATKIAGGTLMLRAAALTFATLLSIVPLFVVLIFVIQTFNLGDRFYGNAKPFLEKTIAKFAEGIPFLNSDKNEIEIPEENLIEDQEGAKNETEDIQPETSASESVENIEESGKSPPADNNSDEIDQDTSLPVENDEAEQLSSEGGKNAEIVNDMVDALFQGVNRKGEEDLEDPAEWLKDTANTVVELASDAATNKAALGISTIVLVITTAFGMMRNVEKTFNNIWGVRATRSWYRTGSDYFMITLLMPIVMSATITVTVALQSERIAEALGPLTIFLDLGKFAITVFVLAALYAVVPSTRVKPRYALLGGLIAGLLWILLTEVYFSSNQALVSRQAILSVFAQFPMLMMWIYFSWAIFILGAEITFAYQNEQTFAMERFAERASYAYREVLGVRAMLEIGKRFQESMDAFAVQKAAANWNVPSRLLNEILYEMEEAGLVRSCATEPVSYQPGRPLDKIHLHEVQAVLRNVGEDPSLLLEDDDYRPFFNDLYQQPDYDKKSVSDVLVHVNPVQTKPDESETE
jgi:membrane protein